MGTLGRTWQLTKQSFGVLSADIEILLFPVMSTLAAILVGATFLAPLYRSGSLKALGTGNAGTDTYVQLFVWYYVNYFVIIFFNSALVACANIRLSGGDPKVRDGLRIASGRIGRIAAWALVAATVGWILRSLEDRSRWLGRLVISLLGLSWTLITYLIVPVIMFEDRGIFDSISRSAELFRRNWGEEVAGGFGFGLLFFLLSIPGVLLAVFGFSIDPALGVALALPYFLILATVASSVRGVFTVALYRYAAQGEVSSAFSDDLVRGAFGSRSPRW